LASNSRRYSLSKIDFPLTTIRGDAPTPRIGEFGSWLLIKIVQIFLLFLLAACLASAFSYFCCCYQISLFQRKMESTGSQVFIKEEMEEEAKDVFSHIVSPVPVKEEDPLER
jgi:hypothetical protein